MRYLGLRIQAAARLGTDASAPASIMKLYSAKQTKRVAELALALEGPYGALAAPDAPAGGAWQRTFLFAPALRIAGGSDQVQRNVMGERVLQLPAEPAGRQGHSVPRRAEEPEPRPDSWAVSSAEHDRAHESSQRDKSQPLPPPRPPRRMRPGVLPVHVPSASSTSPLTIDGDVAGRRRRRSRPLPAGKSRT